MLLRHRHCSSRFAQAIATLVILAIATFNVAYIQGLHLHVLPDGRVTTHSHPVDRNEKDNSQHQHTDKEYAVLITLGKLLQVDAYDSGWSPVYLDPTDYWIESYNEKVISPSVVNSPNKRSPPHVTSV